MMYRNWHDLSMLWVYIKMAYPHIPAWWQGKRLPAVRLKTIVLNLGEKP